VNETSSARSLGCVALGCVLLACAVPGCRRGEVLGKVSGRVTFRGEPVSEGVIVFANEEKGVWMTAEIGPDGTYEVEMAKGFGLPLGTYQVWITPPLVDHPVGPIGTPPPENPPPNIPPKYYDMDKSILSLTVEAGENKYSPDMKP